jgi:hypothetical protein
MSHDSPDLFTFSLNKESFNFKKLSNDTCVCGGGGVVCANHISLVRLFDRSTDETLRLAILAFCTLSCSRSGSIK